MIRWFASLALGCLVAGCANAGAVTRPGGSDYLDSGNGTNADGSTLIPPSGNGLIHVDPEAGTGEFELVDGGFADPGSVSLKKGAVPADIDTQFAGATTVTDASSPALAYPTPATMFPPDIGRILFQWKSTAVGAFHVHFKFPKNTLDVYTDGVDNACTRAGLGGICWESSKDDLYRNFMFEPGTTFTLQISVIDPADPKKAHVSPEYTFQLAPEPALGVIYYWSTTAIGIRRATLDGRGASDYMTASTGLTAQQAQALALNTGDQANRCVACHTLSRSGKKLSVALVGDTLGVIKITETTPPPFSYASASGTRVYGGDAVIGASWAAFNPDETRVVVASQGALAIHDISADHASPKIADIALPGYGGSMPDWAPDGNHIAFTATPSTLATSMLARHIRGSSIAWMTSSGDTFTGLEIIAQSKTMRGDCIDGPGLESYANPMFSPDSKWLLFSRADCETERDPSAEVLLAPAEPAAPMNHLLRANRQVSDSSLTNLTNGMPTWGPHMSGNIAWIAFTSTRDYGLVIASGSKVLSSVTWPVRQLWIAAVDLSKTGAGQDPSYPAFRVPSQDFDENNHRPFWTYDVLPPTFTRKDPAIVK
jgi:hypothetical protein